MNSGHLPKSIIINTIIAVVLGFSLQANGKNYSLINNQPANMPLSTRGSGLPAGLPAALRSRPVTLNPVIASPDMLVPNDIITLNLFTNVVLTAKVDRVSENVNGTVTVRGRIKGYPFGYFLISTTNNNSLGSICIPETDKRYRIQTDINTSVNYLLEEDINLIDELEDAPSPILPPSTQQKDVPADTPAGDPLDPVTFDVMVVYTPAARSWADSSGGGIDNVIAQAVAQGQLAMDNSNTVVTLNLVYSGEIGYTESGDSSTDLMRLTNTDGYMDEVHTLRNTYYADLVGLFTNVSDVGGIGWLLSNPSGSPQIGFSISRVQQASYGYTYVHEMGHNVGCHHHSQQNFQPGPGLFSYSAGWRWTGTNNGKYCSVMTYESGTYFSDGITHTRVAYFSNPAILYQGVATGDAVYGDNARNIREIKNVIAAYRQPTGLTVTGITPNTGITGSTANITYLAGSGFVSGATVKLIKAGQTDITATDVTVVSATKITCTLSLSSAATGTWDVRVTNPDTQSATLSNGFNVSAESGSSSEDFETGDFSKFPWSTSGSANWIVTSQDKNSGTYSANAGTITHSQSTSLEVTVDCTAGNITFYRKVSSESGYDYLRFYIDGVQQSSWSGTVNWSQVTYPVSTGTKTFKWTYSKDSSVSSGSDTAWIDDIAFPISSDCSTIIVGTGTSTWEYPMHTYFHDSRTQVIYLASEIGKSGNISSLSLDVTTVPGQIMNYWTIRMKHTSLSSYSTPSFESAGSGWTIVYQGTEPTGITGLRTFTFNTPFAYNGSDNLMVDFSHNNSTYSTNGYCRASTPGGTRSTYSYTDSGYGDPFNWTGTTSPAVYGSTYIPNLQLTLCGGGQPGPFKISGYIRTSTAAPIEGILVSANTGEVNVTDANGYYEIPFTESPWSGRITPVKAEWTFTPAYRDYTNATSNHTNQNFTGKYSYGGGAGTSNDPYLIYTAEQMNTIGKDANDWNKHFKLMADIDLSSYTGETFNMIGQYEFSYLSPLFIGVFDGSGHSISGFTYYYTGTKQKFIGIFGAIGTPGEIKNLVVVNPDVNGGPQGVGVAAIVGTVESGTVRNCTVTGGIIREDIWNTGGITGECSGQIIDCCSFTTVEGKYMTGGIVGYIWAEGIVQNCKSYSRVMGKQGVGGIAGESAGTITGCFATGIINGESQIGGIIGENNGTISQCFASCDVNASWQEAGGFAGRNIRGTITNCYSNGSVYADREAGGFVSLNWDANIIKCYSTAHADADSFIGGLVEYDINGTITDSFWDIQVSGTTVSNGGTGKTTIQMQTKSTFTNAGWDFVDETTNGPNDIWTIWEGHSYPILSWQGLIMSTIAADSNWMYQNLPGQTNSRITVSIPEIFDPCGNTSFTYQWSFELPDDVNIEPIIISGGGINDNSCTFASPDCTYPNGLSDSGQTFKIKIEITGNDFGNSGLIENEFAIALLGDINNDGTVNITDRSIANMFMRTGVAGSFTLKDCDLNCDGTVNITDRSIANSIMRGALGTNYVSNPCPLR